MRKHWTERLRDWWESPRSDFIVGWLGIGMMAIVALTIGAVGFPWP